MRMRGRKLLTVLISLVIIIVLWCFSYLRNNNVDDDDAFLVHLPAGEASTTATDGASFVAAIAANAGAPLEKQRPPLRESAPGPLLNLTNFEYLLPNDLCRRLDRELLAVLIVTSYAGHDALRAAHRQAITQSKLAEMGLQRIFLLAALPKGEHFITQQQLASEQARFGDLLQGSFIEDYRNLSYKHVMGLRWAATECQQRTKFIIKLDDDIIVDVFFLRRHLESLEVAEPQLASSSTLLAGYVLDPRPPIRNQYNKWFVRKQDYPHALYPAYLSGWLYITNVATAARLVAEASRMPIFWIDDTWLTGIVRARLGIPLIRHNEWYSANAEYLDCCVRDLKLWSYECEYYAGPNGADAKLLVEFLHNVEKCYFDECGKRPVDKSLKQTCVASAKSLLPEHGLPQVQQIKLR